MATKIIFNFKNGKYCVRCEGYSSKVFACNNGTVWLARDSWGFREIKGSIAKGYAKIDAKTYHEVGYTKQPFKHRLIADAYLKHKDGMEINHINGIRNDNSLINLEWVTHSQNEIHKHYILGNNVTAVDQLTLTNVFIKSYRSYNEASRDAGVNSGSILHCCDTTHCAKTAGGFKWRYGHGK